MNCFINCMRNRLGWIITAALIGAFIGGVLGVLIGCGVAGGTLGIAGGPAAAIGAALACTGVSLAVLLPIVIIGAILGFVIGGALAVLAFAAICGSACMNAASIAGANGVTGGLGTLFPNEPLDCAAATALTAELEKQLADARAARDAQQALVNNRQSAFNTARNAWVAALAALAATSLWNPIAMAIAAVAVAATTAAMVLAQARLIAEQVKLAELIARVAALEAALAMAMASQQNLCGNPASGGGTGDDGLGDGITLDIINPPGSGGGGLLG